MLTIGMEVPSFSTRFSMAISSTGKFIDHQHIDHRSAKELAKCHNISICPLIDTSRKSRRYL